MTDIPFETYYEDVKNQTTEEYFGGNQFSIDAFNKKYKLHEDETYVIALKRVCDFIASVEETDELKKYWSDRWFSEIYNDWWHPAGSIMQGAGSGKKISLTNCFRRSTEFITDKGIKSFGDFNDGDVVNVLTKQNAFSPAVVKNFGKQKLTKLVVGRNGFTKEIHTTNGHQWETVNSAKTHNLVKTTSELVVGDKIPFVKKTVIKTFCSIGFIHGLIFGDGSLSIANDCCMITLCSDSTQFKSLFDKFGYHTHELPDGKVSVYGLPNYMKSLPDLDNINDAYLTSFLQGWFAADGTIDKEGRSELSSSNYELLLTVANRIASLGIWVTNIREVRDKSPFDGNPNHKLYSMYFSKDSLYEEFFMKENHKDKFRTWINGREKVKNPNYTVLSVEQTDIEEDVWCVEENTTHTFTLKDFCRTKNCTTVSLGNTKENENWDNLESIIRNTSYKVAKYAAYRQGLGVDFSKLRPVGTKVLNSSNKSQGAIHWMKFIDSIGYYVGQMGRIPAMLFSLSCTHPDVIDFIKVKSDYTKIQNANISVQCTNEFYKAVENDAEWEMSFEIPEVKIGDKVYVDEDSTNKDCILDKNGKHYYVATNYRPYEKTSAKESARKILELIAKNMFNNAEPGIQNIDIARKYSNSDYLYDPKNEHDSRIASSNACCFAKSKDVFVKTSNGLKEIKSITENDKVWLDVDNKYVETTGYFSAGIDRVYKVSFDNDKYFLITNNHKLCKFGGYGSIFDLTELQYLEVGDCIVCENGNLTYITSIEYSHEEEVGCISVPNYKYFNADGILSGNSEQYLSPDSCCVLASTNAQKFSHDPIVYEKELEIIGPSVNRFLDNVNQCELKYHTYATPQQRIAIEQLRRTGAGYTNIGGWLFKNNAEYGSEHGNGLIEKFTERYNYHLYRSSIDLGKEKGNFGLFDRKKFEQSPFVKRMMELGLKFSHMRNVTCSSIAPTGTLSLMFRELIMSYGIEPAFGLYHWKRTRISGKYEYYFCVPRIVREVFKTKGHEIPMLFDSLKDTWDGSLGKPVADFIDKHKNDIGIKFKNATEVSPMDKLDLMAKVMKWVDSSISVTYMLPENTEWKDIYDFILEANKREVKSIAAFPDRKMYGIITFVPFKDLAVKLTKENVQIHPQNFTNEELNELNVICGTVLSEDKIVKTQAPKRPKALSCDVHHIKAMGKDYAVIVGLLHNEPYEVFAWPNGTIDRKITNGIITKIERGHYKVVLQDGSLIENVTEDTTENEDSLTRMVSTALRHGADISFVVSQLEKVKGSDLQGFARSISRALKKYIPDGASVSGQCPECKKSELIRSEGCISCACGWSKCS